MSSASQVRLLQAALVVQAVTIASPIATLDGLVTAPRAFGAQLVRSDPVGALTSLLPFLVALVPVVILGVAARVPTLSPGSRRAARIVSALSVVVAALPRLREMTFAAEVVHGLVLGVAGIAALVVLQTSRHVVRPDATPRRIRGRIAFGVSSWVGVLAVVGALAGTIPTAPFSAWISSGQAFSGATPHGRLDVPPAAQNPFLAPNPTSNIHSDGAMTDAYDDRTVLDPREAEVLTRHLGGVCASVLFDEQGRLIAVCVSPTRVRLHVLDPRTLDVLARKLVATRPFRWDFPTNFAGGGYAVLDEQGRVVLPTADGRITRWKVSDAQGRPAISLVDEFNVSSILVPGEAITSAVPDASGPLWFVGQMGTVAVLDTGTGQIESMRFDDVDIENSFAVAKGGGAYVVTSKELVFLDLVDGAPHERWAVGYDRGTRQKPGQTSRASGTTPTLLDDERFVAITDNADPRMHVLVFATDPGLSAGEREVCRIPVFRPGRSATDNSLIALGRSLFVENNYGYSLFTATGGRSVEPGMSRIDVAADGSDCTLVWANDEVRVPSVVSKGTASGAIVSYTKPVSVWGADAWYFTVIDATSGAELWRVRAGTGPMVNNHYAATYVGPDGAIYTGATGGLVALVPRT